MTRDQEIIQKFREGLTGKQVGELFNISSQRVHQIIKKYEEETGEVVVTPDRNRPCTKYWREFAKNADQVLPLSHVDSSDFIPTGRVFNTAQLSKYLNICRRGSYMRNALKRGYIENQLWKGKMRQFILLNHHEESSDE